METSRPNGPPVNNTIYETLGARWYQAHDDPVALLRAESRLRNPWLVETLERVLGTKRSVLDIGCGGGFLSNALAKRGHRVTGLDLAQDSLDVAAAHDETGSVRYVRGDALHLPFGDRSFDAVSAMDFLEHVDQPERAIAEISRVLIPGGQFFFHTFNRNWLSWLVIIKGVEWFVQNTPKDMHVLRLFIKPTELASACERNALSVVELFGSRPRFGAPFWKMLWSGSVPESFAFTFTRSTRLGYTGVAVKREHGLDAVP